MKPRTAIFAASIVAATLATLTVPRSRFAVWNTSASLPTGLYWIRAKQHRYVGERVAVEPPPELRRLLAERGYLPVGVPLLKRVAAVSGHHVCRFAHGITIDGELAGVARSFDRRGRPLPVWSGCHRIKSDELFVMNTDAPDSFDGRYFGVLRKTDVIGRATPVWTDEAGDGDHVWFASPAISEPSPQQKGPRP
jgi:conjugative transfer signal peptidase TraF